MASGVVAWTETVVRSCRGSSGCTCSVRPLRARRRLAGGAIQIERRKWFQGVKFMAAARGILDFGLWTLDFGLSSGEILPRSRPFARIRSGFALDSLAR